MTQQELDQPGEHMPSRSPQDDGHEEHDHRHDDATSSAVVSLRVGHTTLRTSVSATRARSPRLARPFSVCTATNSAAALDQQQADDPQQKRLVGEVVEGCQSAPSTRATNAPAHFAASGTAPVAVSYVRCAHGRYSSTCHVAPGQCARQVRNSTRLKFQASIARTMAGQEGIEPPTCGFGDRRSAN